MCVHAWVHAWVRAVGVVRVVGVVRAMGVICVSVCARVHVWCVWCVCSVCLQFNNNVCNCIS